MTISLNDAAQTAVHTMSELVDGVTNRLEDLPGPFHHRRSRPRATFPALAALVLGALAIAVWVKRRNGTHDVDTSRMADRPPTHNEERAAERGAADVDLVEVAKHADEMAKTGAKVRGEGEIEPSTKVKRG